MPPRLSARQILWIGIILTVVGVFIQKYLSLLIYSIGGPDALNAGMWPLINTSWLYLLLPLGTTVLACSLLARIIESDVRTVPSPKTGRLPSPPKLTARQMAWAGVALLVFGLILATSIGGIFYDLSGKIDLSSNLARDLLTIIGDPLATIAVPLGTALLPCALVARMLETHARAWRRGTTEVLTRP